MVVLKQQSGPRIDVIIRFFAFALDFIKISSDCFEPAGFCLFLLLSLPTSDTNIFLPSHKYSRLLGQISHQLVIQISSPNCDTNIQYSNCVSTNPTFSCYILLLLLVVLFCAALSVGHLRRRR